MSVSKTIEPFIHNYSHWIKYSGVGAKALGIQGWNTGVKKNIPRHYMVRSMNLNFYHNEMVTFLSLKEFLKNIVEKNM